MKREMQRGVIIKTLRREFAMRSTKVVLYLFVCLFLSMGIAIQAFADSAEVLPKGIFRAHVDTEFYFPIDKRFDKDGNTEDVSRYFNATLNSNIFPELAPLDNIMGGPGSAIIGRTEVSFKYKDSDVMLGLEYGVTDRLTVGIFVPYWWQKTDVSEARLNTTNATVGKNPFFGTPGDPFGGAPIIPLGLGGIPLTTEDIQDLLGGGLIINGKIAVPGYGYKRVKTWSDNGLGDIEAGARYQYFKNDNWRLAFTGGVRFPTGDVDDPDNLIDLGFGSGTYTLLFRLNNDYTGIKNLVLNATIRYDLTLSDEETKRVTSVQHPIVPETDKERVSRNIGDIVELEGSGTYQFSEGWNVCLLYRYDFKTKKDDISGDRNLDYSALEDETDWTYHLISAGVSYSTLPLFMAKKFPLPLIASIEYQNVFAGTNNFLKQHLFAIKLAAYF
jgi:hypothetical protein